MSLLAVSLLSASLGRSPVLQDVSFTVDAGEFVGLIGPNGAGKSTLLRSILGLVSVKGTVEFSGRASALLTHQERAQHVAYLAQDRDIAWSVPVDLLVGLGRATRRASFEAESDADRAAVAREIERMDLTALVQRDATSLSGGEKARVLIARVMAQETPLILADEPTAGLDPSHQIGLMELFSTQVAAGKSLVASLHDLALAARWCTRLILIDAGRIVADGPATEVLTPQNMREVYGVEAYFGEAGGKPIVLPISRCAARTTIRRRHD